VADPRPEVVNIKFALESQTAILEATRFQKALTKRLKMVEKSEKDLNNGLTKYIHKMGRAKQMVGPVLQKELKVRKAIKEAIRTTRDSLDRVLKSSEDLKSHQIDAEKELLSLQKAAVALRRKGGDGDGSSVKAAESKVAAARERVAAARDEVREREQVAAITKSELASLQKQQKSLRSLAKARETSSADLGSTGSIKHLATALRESGEDLAKPFQALLNKDLPGAFREGGTLAAKMLKKALVLSKLGESIKKHPSKAEGMGAGLKGMASLAGSMAPLIQGISKILPLLSIVGSLVMGLVKFLLDGEKAFKDFNKAVLESAGSGDFLAGSMGDVGKATQATKTAMRDAYKQTLDLGNITKGVTKEMAVAFRSQMGAEGVSTSRLNQEIAKVPQTVGDLAGGLSSFNDVLWTSVAYSRSFGVSLQELTQFQGQMVAEVGMGTASTTAEFARVASAAGDAGMHAGKFFGIVRSFSADLSLFALRMADVTSVLGTMAKAMDPKSAQKLLQTLAGVGKEDIHAKLKRFALAGTEGQGIAKRSVKRGISATMGELKLAPQTMTKLQAAMESGNTDEVENILATMSAKEKKDTTGPQMEAILTLTRDMGRANEGSPASLAAIKSLDLTATSALAEAESMRAFGVGISALDKNQLLAVQAVLDFDDATIDQIKTMNSELSITRKDLAHKLEAGTALTATEVKILERLGVTTRGAAGAAAVRASNNEALSTALVKDQAELLAQAEVDKKAQDGIAGETVTTLDQFSDLVDAMLGKIFMVLEGLGLTTVAILAAIIASGGGKALVDIAKGLGGGGGKLAGLAGGGGGKLAQAGGRLATGGKALANAATPIVVNAAKTILPALTGVATSAATLAATSVAAAPAAAVAVAVSTGLAAYSLANMAGAEKWGASLGNAIYDFFNSAPTPTAATAPRAAPATTAATAATPTAAPIAATARVVPVPRGGGNEAQEATTQAALAVDTTLQTGVPLATSTIDQLGLSTLDAIRTGLFEYYMYKDLDQGAVAQGLMQGKLTPGGFGQGIVGGARATGSPQGALSGMLLGANADGGIVSSIANGIAHVRPAPGEGLASVGTGERISPRGGGGGGNVKVELELKGDLRRFIDARVVDGTAQFERNKRLR